MNSKAVLAVAIGVISAIGAPNMVLAQGAQMGQDPIAMYVAAGATAEQQKQIRTLAHDFEMSARVKIERAQNLLKKIQMFSLEPLPDEKTVLATQAEFNQLQSDLATERIKLMLQIRNVLTDEQRVKLVQLLKDSRAQQAQGM